MAIQNISANALDAAIYSGLAMMNIDPTDV